MFDYSDIYGESFYSVRDAKPQQNYKVSSVAQYNQNYISNSNQSHNFHQQQQQPKYNTTSGAHYQNKKAGL